MNCNCGNSRCCVPEKGERGLKGTNGIQGNPGPAGADGTNGDKGDPGDPGAPASLLDTGWHDLEGFCFMTTPPQARRIGTVIYFRGSVMIPLTDGTGNPLVQNAQNANYEENVAVTPATLGNCSVDIDTAGGGIFFNNDTNVLPTAVVDLNLNPLDATGQQPYIMGGRRVLVEEDVDPGNLTSTFLTTTGNMVLTNQGKLIWATLRDYEDTIISAYRSDYSYNTSHINTIISHIHAGHRMPNYDSVSSTLHNNGAAIPAGGNLPVLLDYELDGHSLSPTLPTKSFLYRMSVNGNDERQVGGFTFNISNLRVYLDPI